MMTTDTFPIKIHLLKWHGGLATEGVTERKAPPEGLPFRLRLRGGYDLPDEYFTTQKSIEIMSSSLEKKAHSHKILFSLERVEDKSKAEPFQRNNIEQYFANIHVYHWILM